MIFRRRLLRIAALIGTLGTAVAFSGQTARTVTDSLGRRVAIPGAAKRVLSLQPEITRLVVALGAGECLVGIDYFLRNFDDLFKIIYPRQDRLPLVSMANYNVNLEVLAGLGPDVIFGPPEDGDVIHALETKTRIPVAAFSSMGRFGKLLEELRLIGLILGREDRAEELAAYFEAQMGRIQARLSDVPAGRKPRVFLSFWNVLANTPVFYEPVNAAGGLNVAEGSLPSYAGTLNAVVPVERILAWAPDLILLQGNYPPEWRELTVASVLADRRLTSLQAVKDNKIYYTFGFWNWWDFAEVIVETFYLAKLFHPDRFADLDLIAEGNSVFRKVYRIENGFSTLCRVLRFEEWGRGR
jgi:iron complex transport system substrate-binding protein